MQLLLMQSIVIFPSRDQEKKLEAVLKTRIA